MSAEQTLLLADIPEMREFANETNGTIVIFTLDKSVAPCPNCEQTTRYYDRKDIAYVKFAIADSTHPVLEAVRAHQHLEPGTAISFPFVFDHTGKFAWNDMNRFEMMNLEKQLVNAV